jgi:hypothetical protein
MRNLLRQLMALVLLTSASCETKKQVQSSAPAVASPSPSQQTVSWSSDPTVYMTDNEPLRRAWMDFERSQKYQLAKPSDRILSSAAADRVSSNNPNQIKPFLGWWGAHGFVNGDTKDFLVAIVVDPTRSDANRYGLVVIAKPKSEGAAYNVYWVVREEDMESYLISPASGSVFMECFRRDGTEQTKELAWDRKSRQFRLI